MKAKAWIRSFATAAAAFILFSGNASAQVTQQMQQRLAKPPATNITAYNGKVSGFVYWDTTKVIRNTDGVPPGCAGTQITVWIAGQDWKYDRWEASASSITYSMKNSFGLCAYTVDRVPVGQTIVVSATVPSAYYSFATGETEWGDMGVVRAPGNPPAMGVQLGGGFALEGAGVTVVSTPCRDLVSSGSPTSLTSGPRSCSAQASNVNLVIGSVSQYLQAWYTANFGSGQRPTEAQMKTMAQATLRAQQTLSGGSLQPQSAGSTNTGVNAQRAPMSPTSPLANPARAPAPMLGTSGQPLLANGGTPAPLMAQTPKTANATMAGGSRPTASAAVAPVNPVGVTSPKTGGQQGSVSLYGSAANTMSKVTIGGTVSGYIFWDARRVAYNPSVPCQGLTVQLSDITGTGIYQLGSTNPSQAQPTGRTQAGSSLELCSYTFNRVPEGVALQVQVNISQSFAAQVVAKGPFPLGATGTLVKVAGGPCNNPPSGESLQSGWQSCGDQTSNVNFELVPRRAIRTFPAPNGAR